MAKTQSTTSWMEPVELPTLNVMLPSRSVLYKNVGEKVGLRSMTMADENLFFSLVQQDLEKAIDVVLSRCLTTKELSVDQILVADKYYLFIMLRAVSFGSSYTFDHKCLECGDKSSHTFDLMKDFNCKYLADDDTEPFKTTLPVSGKEVEFRLARVFDLRATETFNTKEKSKRSSQTTLVDLTSSFSLARLLVTVDTNDTTQVSPEKLAEYVSTWPARDTSHLRTQIDFYTPGLDTSCVLHCKNAKCGTDAVVDLPITVDFFRPRRDESGTS